MKIPDEITPQEVEGVIQYLQEQLREQKLRSMNLVETIDALLIKLQQKDMEIVTLKRQIIDRGIA